MEADREEVFCLVLRPRAICCVKEVICEHLRTRVVHRRMVPLDLHQARLELEGTRSRQRILVRPRACVVLELVKEARVRRPLAA